jgi:hypothetical protein
LVPIIICNHYGAQKLNLLAQMSSLQK